MRALFVILLITCQVHAATYNWTNVPNATGYGPGDSVTNWGTFTNSWTITNSGTASSPIVFTFAPGAKFSAPTIAAGTFWVYMSGCSNIVLDGGQNGTFELTDNGTPVSLGGTHTYTNQNLGAIYAQDNGGLRNVTFKNLNFRRFYDRQTNSESAGNGLGAGITMVGSFITVSNCTFDTMQDCIGVIYSTAPSSNFVVTACTLTNFNHGISLGSASAGATFYNFIVTNNTIQTGDSFEEQDGMELGLHRDPIFIFNSTFTDTTVSNIVIAFNTIKAGTNPKSHGAGTAAIYTGTAYNTNCVHVRIYNNVSILAYPLSWSGGQGAMGAWGVDVLVANNTIIGWPTNGAWGGSEISVSGTNGFLFNNLVLSGAAASLRNYTDTTGLTNNAATMGQLLSGLWSDYNVFNHQAANNAWSAKVYSADNWYWYLLDQFSSGSYAWQTYFPGYAAHFDPHGTTNLAALDANYVPLSTDTVARGQGTNLSAFFTTDFNGNARPAVGNWTIGAFESAGSSGASPASSQTVLGWGKYGWGKW